MLPIYAMIVSTMTQLSLIEILPLFLCQVKLCKDLIKAYITYNVQTVNLLLVPSI